MIRVENKHMLLTMIRSIRKRKGQKENANRYKKKDGKFIICFIYLLKENHVLLYQKVMITSMIVIGHIF